MKTTLTSWADAHGLAGLGELTARWLEGDLPVGHPNYGLPGEAVGPDPETGPLIPALAAYNRAGYVTVTSQPGEPDGTGYDGEWWQQRAGVMGFATVGTLNKLKQAAKDHPDLLLIVTHTKSRRRATPIVPVTMRRGQGYTWFGGRMTRRYIRFAFRGCHRDGLNALTDAWQVTLIDLVWGRDTVLWPLISTALGVDDQ